MWAAAAARVAGRAQGRWAAAPAALVRGPRRSPWAATTALLLSGAAAAIVVQDEEARTPLTSETAVLTHAPNVPPPITRRHPVRLAVNLDTTSELLPVSNTHKYEMWTFNGHTPGPFVRARVGDVLEVRFTNKDKNGLAHNIDFHAVTGPGGGAPALYAEENQTRVGTFALVHPGLFVYHCSAEPVASHIANGMFGLILVEPEEVRRRVPACVSPHAFISRCAPRCTTKPR